MSIRTAATSIHSFRASTIASSSCIASSSRRCLATPAELPPIPQFSLPEIHLGQTHLARYHEHYDSSLASDLMYMEYDHRLARKPPKPEPPVKAMSPYEVNRPEPYKFPIPKAKPMTSESVPKLERITIHSMSKHAITNKHNLLSVIMSLRAISGESVNGGGKKSSTGVQIVTSKMGVAPWRLREGMPIAAKVELKGEAMYDFVQSLVDFVLPRLREFNGVPMVNSRSAAHKNSSSGTVQMGFDAGAMGLFPQIEPNIDNYPRLSGFSVHFHTNARGPKAQATARAVLSGFRIPFYRA